MINMSRKGIKKDSNKGKRLKDKVKVKSDNKKQYSITLKGYEKAKAETLGIAGIKAERLGIKIASEKIKDPKVLELKSNITYYENKIHERQLEIKAFRTELKQLEKELSELISYENLKGKIVKRIEPIYKEFLETGSSDLSDFYAKGTNYYDRLDIIRMKNNLNNFEELVEIFEEYLEELNEKTVLISSTTQKAKE